MAERPTKSEKDISVTLAAGDTVRVSRIGRDFQCISVTTDGVVQIGLSQSALAGRFLYKGMGEVLPPGEDNFDFIELNNTAGTPQTVVLQTSRGNVRDARLNLIGGTIPVSVTNTVTVTEAGATTITPAALVTVATANHLDIPANAARKLLAIYSDSSLDTAWIRDTGGTTSIGIPLGPKSTWSMPFTGAIRVRNNSGNPIDIYWTEIV